MSPGGRAFAIAGLAEQLGSPLLVVVPGERDAEELVDDLSLFADNVLLAPAWETLPFEHVSSIRMAPPQRVRDLIWAPATIRTGPAFRGAELGDVLLPVLTPDAARHADRDVRLGRATHWDLLPDGRQMPVGQKLLLVDDEELSILELRDVDIELVPADAA